MFRNDGSTFTAFGELYAAWDGDRVRQERTPYFIQGLASMHRLRASSTTSLPGTGDIRRSDVSAQWALVPNASANRHYVVSLRDGRRLRFDGTTLDLAPPGTPGSFVEWTFNGPDGNGYTFIDHPATSKSLRLSRTNDGNGAPTSLNYGMENFGTVQDATRWRFIKSFQPAGTAPPATIVNVRATGGFGRVTLAWSASAATNILRYSVYRRLSASSAYTQVATGLTAPGWIDNNVFQGTTYRYVVTATDWIENESAQSAEASAMSIGPRLTISQSAESLSLSWPTGLQTYRLMSATNLTPPIDWMPEPGATLSNGLWTFATPPGTNSDRFFRLQWP